MGKRLPVMHYLLGCGAFLGDATRGVIVASHVLQSIATSALLYFRLNTPELPGTVSAQTASSGVP